MVTDCARPSVRRGFLISDLFKTIVSDFNPKSTFRNPCPTLSSARAGTDGFRRAKLT